MGHTFMWHNILNKSLKVESECFKPLYSVCMTTGEWDVTGKEYFWKTQSPLRPLCQLNIYKDIV